LVHDFSHYRIVARLGQGGMGEVFAADDLTLNRRVALKFLLPVTVASESTDPASGENLDGRRLLREARAAAQLDHPFICKIYEVGEHDGRAFFAMEYVDGLTLKERLANGPLSIDEATRIAGEIAEALHLAHTRGIIHRDLKPANVMLGTDGHVKVMDFGVAKRVATAAAGMASDSTALVTQPGGPVGTLAYMSPEQIRVEAVDARSDVFAFGVLFYELLTRVHPFQRPSMIEMAHAILNEPASPPDERVPGLSPLLGHIVRRCLEKDRERRYQSLSDVRIELEGTQGSAVLTPALPARPKLRAFRLVALAVLVALAAAGVVYWTRPLDVFAPPAHALAFQERDWIVVSDFNNLTNDQVFDKSLRVALEVAIAQSHYVNVYPSSRVAATLQRMQKKSERLDEALASEVALRDGVRGVLACDIAQLGNVYALTARLLDPQTRAAVHTELVQAPDKDGVLRALGELATRVRSRLGESRAALSAQAKPLPMVTTSSLDALKLYADALKLENDRTSFAMLHQAVTVDPDFALAHAELGRRYYLESRRELREAGERHFTKALELTDRLSVRERLWIQAVAEDARGNRQRAVDAFQAYLKHYPDDARAWFRMAWTQMAALNQPRDAIAGFQQVLRLQPDDPSTHVNLASAYAGAGDLQAAVPAYHRAFALSPPLMFGPFVNHEYGFTLIRTGRLADAEATFVRMTKEGELNKSKGHRSLALLEMYRGRYAAATAELRRAIVLDQATQESVSEFRDRMYLVTTLDARGERREADLAWTEVDRLIRRLSLDPSWLSRPVRRLARLGRVREAQGLVLLMRKTLGNTISDSSVARNLDRDRAYLELAQAEIELARGQAARAVALLEPLRELLKRELDEPLGAAYMATGRVSDAIARYEEILRGPRFGDELQQAWLDAHITLGGLYERTAQPDAARRVYSALIEQWKDGDDNLPALVAARARLASLSR
jgi:eukaryotic-like serine/threonine-protein kinase